MFTDTVTLLRQMPSGSTLWSREQIDGGTWEVAWLVREQSARLAKLGTNPEIEFRAGLLWEGGVGLIPVLVRVGPASNRLAYETWINEHAEGFSGTLATLAKQGRLVVHFYGNGCHLERTLTVSNDLATFAGQALNAIATRPPWTMQAFD